VSDCCQPALAPERKRQGPSVASALQRPQAPHRRRRGVFARLALASAHGFTWSLTLSLTVQRDGHEIMEHPFFYNIDWKALYNLDVPAPFVPK
jgi:hypothetical protein